MTVKRLIEILGYMPQTALVCIQSANFKVPSEVDLLPQDEARTHCDEDEFENVEFELNRAKQRPPEPERLIVLLS